MKRIQNNRDDSQDYDLDTIEDDLMATDESYNVEVTDKYHERGTGRDSRMAKKKGSIRGTNKGSKMGPNIKENRLIELNRIINKEAKKITNVILEKIKSLLKVDEMMAKKYYAELHKMVKTKQPSLTELDTVVKISDITDSHTLKKIRI